MCLIALALGQHERFPVVIAANRDEFMARPALPLAWWSPDGEGKAILAGRDLESGGTWLGLSRTGRLAMLTNVREPHRTDPTAVSRGHLVPQWLSSDESFDRFWQRSAASKHNGFNLIAADVQRGEWHWASNRSAEPCVMSGGVHAVSNALLDTPWPKTVALKQTLTSALSGDQDRQAARADELAERLFATLSNRQRAPDGDLPVTGVSLELERVLSASFIRNDDNSYGTRCSTVVISERIAGSDRCATHVFERSFDRVGNKSCDRHEILDPWPAFRP